MFGLFAKPSEKHFKTIARAGAQNGLRAIEHVAMHDMRSGEAIKPYVDGVHPQIVGSAVLAIVLHTELSISLSAYISESDTPIRRAHCYGVVEEFHHFVTSDRHFNSVGWSRISRLDAHLHTPLSRTAAPLAGWGDALVIILRETDSVLAERLRYDSGFKPVAAAFDSYMVSTYGAAIRALRRWELWLA